MKKSIILGVFALTALTFGACTKAKDGAPGAQGPEGNANVVGTNTVTIPSSSWAANGTTWTTGITAAGITQDVVNKGSVQVFIQYGTEWWALPDLTGINSTSFGFSLGHVALINANSDFSQATNPGTQTFRIVIITSRAMTTHPNVDLKNYNAVKNAFNLKD